MPSSDSLSSADPRIQPISDWLVTCGLNQVSIADMLDGVCRRLTDEIGFELLRANVSTRTLHPVIDSISYVWRRDTGSETTPQAFSDNELDRRQNSPLRPIVEAHDTRLHRTPLDRGNAVFDYPVFAEFRDLGATEHIARLVGFGIDGEPDGHSGMMTTWLTDRAGGFTDSEVDILERLIPRLALSVKSTLGYQISANLLDTYVGHDAGQRILSGAYRRGTFRIIPASILYADLRGFTALSDRLPHEAVANLLNACFDAMAEPVTQRGGEVLKFLGDGLLAIFDREDRDDSDICYGALDAAHEAIAAVAKIKVPDEEETMALDVALHLGDVLHGNVGTADRLDFTVIGPAVNEASRIETLCDQLGHQLLVSSTFAAASARCNRPLKSVGRHRLRGVETEQELFTAP